MPGHMSSAQAGSARRPQGAGRDMPGGHPLAVTWQHETPRVALSPSRRARLFETLQRIGQAEPDMDGCGEVLDAVTDALDAEQGVLVLSNPLTMQLEFVISRQPAERSRSYAEYYADLDPSGVKTWLTESAPQAPSSAARVADLDGLVDYRWLHGTEFYTDFLRPSDIEHALVAVCTSAARSRVVACLHRSQERAHFSPEDLTAMDVLAPFVGNHLQRMIGTTVLAALPEKAAGGVVLCDDQGRVLYCNDAARVLLGDGMPLDAVSSLVRDANEAPGFVGHVLQDPSRLAEGREVTTNLQTVPLGADRLGTLVTLDAPGLLPHRAEILNHRFALTDRELQVLDAMMGGATNREIAAALFVAECTVKKHMQSISTKVGARTRTGIAHAVRVALEQSG